MLNGGGYISITPKGVNEVEEVRQTTNSQINNVTHNNTINSSGESSVANIGDNNQSTINIATAIGELVQNIEAADASEDEKEEAKTLLNRAIKNPLIGNLLGGAISGLTSGALT